MVRRLNVAPISTCSASALQPNISVCQGWCCARLLFLRNIKRLTCRLVVFYIVDTQRQVEPGGWINSAPSMCCAVSFWRKRYRINFLSVVYAYICTFTTDTGTYFVDICISYGYLWTPLKKIIVNTVEFEKDRRVTVHSALQCLKNVLHVLLWQMNTWLGAILGYRIRFGICIK